MTISNASSCLGMFIIFMIWLSRAIPSFNLILNKFEHISYFLPKHSQHTTLMMQEVSHLHFSCFHDDLASHSWKLTCSFEFLSHPLTIYQTTFSLYVALGGKERGKGASNIKFVYLKTILKYISQSL